MLIACVAFYANVLYYCDTALCAIMLYYAFMRLPTIIIQQKFSFSFFVLQQQQNLGRRFGTSKMHLSPTVA